MRGFLSRNVDRFYAIFRIVVGFLFLFHGLQKLFGAFGGEPVELVSLMGLAGTIELTCGLLVMHGLFARWAAFLASGMMAVAYFMAHFPRAFWPIENKGELAVVYCFAFLYIAARGAGPWSLAQALGRPGLD
jgi:putative oxidoreductase